jgi:hypothetical protein
MSATKIPLVLQPPSKTEPKPQQRHFPWLTVMLVIAVAAGLWDYGGAYYSLPLGQRPDSPLHSELAPSAPVGRWLGIIGTLMMTSILLYPLRKKIRWLEKAGNIRLWLSLHIFMGLTGPVLITFHTGFKMGGIVSIAYWSMVITVLSGVFGRYIYVQIPRDTSGERLSKVHIGTEAERLESQLAHCLAAYPTLFSLAGVLLQGQAGVAEERQGIAASLVQDIGRPLKLWSLRRSMRKQAGLDRRRANEISRLVQRRSVLLRRLGLIDTMEKIFHHWHVLHRPFVWIMFIVVVLHIGVALLFGYAGL